MSKITDHKLNGSNYLDWSKSVRLYLQSIDKDNHMVDPPKDEYRRISYSIDNEVIELMDYLGFLYSGKGDISRIYEVYKAFYQLMRNMLLPFSSNVKVQQQQRDQMAVMSFLARLSLEFEIAKAQVLFGYETSSLQEFFSRVLHTKNTPFVQTSGAQISRHNNDFGRSYSKINAK
ncbi:hypothetical protein ACP275_12G052600 [Erythranthe tilingii]